MFTFLLAAVTTAITATEVSSTLITAGTILSASQCIIDGCNYFLKADD